MKISSKIKRFFLTTLGRHVLDLLEEDTSNWTAGSSSLAHKDGLKLIMIPGMFDVADPGHSDFINELGFLDRMILWPTALRLRHRLKYPAIKF